MPRQDQVGVANSVKTFARLPGVLEKVSEEMTLASLDQLTIKIADDVRKVKAYFSALDAER